MTSFNDVGKILPDDQQLENCNFKEGAFVVVMVTKASLGLVGRGVMIVTGHVVLGESYNCY